MKCAWHYSKLMWLYRLSKISLKPSKKRALGREVQKTLNPGQAFLKIVQTELELAMGEVNESLNLAMQPPAVLLMAGLQGAGKTTSVAKLALLLKNKEKKSVLVVSADVYRPAAIKQLQTLASEVDVEFFPSDISQKPIDIANAAIAHAKKKFIDVVIVDTAGRLHVDYEHDERDPRVTCGNISD